MAENGPLSDVASGIGAVIKLGSDSPRMRDAGGNLAYSLDVITGVIKTVLMPLAVVNARAQDFFETKFPELLAEKLAAVPPENLETPKPSVAGPTLQGLNYSHEEPELRDMYMSLLATAMDSRVSTSAHPAFAEIVSALSAAEVAPLDILVRRFRIDLARLKVVSKGSQGYTVIRNHLGPWMTGDKPAQDPMLPAYLDNWARLGLIRISYTSHSVGEDTYDWVELRPEFKQEEALLGPDQSLRFDKGIAEITEFGRAFARAVGVLDPV
ncbi:DUF4393 domain-containing protein [Salinibacterium sp. NSLL150]|uniref:DUF4393 domain-containing protein n=1 Tax=unclassified Salinibacterium TaxID=2632331 RepID=UPI0018CF6788|nr:MULTISPECIES: DUF4393 domain-containing protein [unclassified Salinibacterium]MBH0099923.1 DUF4393 domain-containing protein [Salinibacterium sp. NSLL35]MBH0102677.1 DUF4393 domain-containing protein [Salinibacterium sp. NSLL150]MBH0105437.1 DUF4393 domain-containing protein [Salinibacterium sp. NSLL16]MBH0108197.1 DUF4393 domain-containing protein [Salinibacterium sp. NSLL17]